MSPPPKTVFRALIDGLRPHYSELEEAVGVIQLFSPGPFYIVGGFIYRHIVEQLYGVPVPADTDMDFVVPSLRPKVERTYREIQLPEGWMLHNLNDFLEYGNTWLEHNGRRIEFWSIQHARGLCASAQRNLPAPTIYEYFDSVPFNV